MRLLTYLACPYSSPDARVRRQRFRDVTDAFKTLTERERWTVFSPITSSHPLHELGLDGDWRFWRRIDTDFLKLSKRIVVLTLEGWQTSVGVTAEIKIAKQMGLPIWYMSPLDNKLSKTP